MTPNYRSLVPGGFYSSTPFDRSIHASIRCNNPGAVNGASWEKRYPGYVDTVETTPGNKTTIFEAPEYGVAVWWQLLRHYAAAGVHTVETIITKYGGGQDYSGYVKFVCDATGFQADQEVPLDDDNTLLPFGRAMFRYEAGQPIPWRDGQILFGLNLGRSEGDLEALQPLPRQNLADLVMPLAAIADGGSANGASQDRDHIAKLVQLGSDVQSLQQAQATAATSMQAAGYGYTLHNACAATLSAFLKAAGIPVRTMLGAGKLAAQLRQERGWHPVTVGQQQPGDVGVAKADVHIYLVVRVDGADAMVIADNQAPTPHGRSANGRDGRTPTAYFLRATEGLALKAALTQDLGIHSIDEFYPGADENTNDLRDAGGDVRANAQAGGAANPIPVGQPVDALQAFPDRRSAGAPLMQDDTPDPIPEMGAPGEVPPNGLTHGGAATT